MKPACLLIALLLASTGCSSEGIENKEAVRQAMIEYLKENSSQTGLDPATMDVNVDAVSFQRGVAQATVSFLIKGSDQGMQMNYTLDRVGDKWVTRKRPAKGAPHPAIESEQTPPPAAIPGVGPGTTPGGQLPAGHPPVDGKTK